MLSAGKSAVSGFMARTRARPEKRPAGAVEYPYSDGKAMAESPRHADAILYALATLRNRFAGSRFVQVGANMNLFYEEGDPEKKLVPDLFVVRSLAALPEPSYKVWEAGRPPDFVLEVASPSSAGRERGEKQVLYASMGVAEYWRFNPGGTLKGGLRRGGAPGRELVGGSWVRAAGLACGWIDPQRGAGAGRASRRAAGHGASAALAGPGDGRGPADVLGVGGGPGRGRAAAARRGGSKARGGDGAALGGGYEASRRIGNRSSQGADRRVAGQSRATRNGRKLVASSLSQGAAEAFCEPVRRTRRAGNAKLPAQGRPAAVDGGGTPY